MFSNHSNLNHYSLESKVFKEVVVNHPLQSPAQRVTCGACSPRFSKPPSWMIKDRGQEELLMCLGWINPMGQCPYGSSLQRPGPATKQQHLFQTPHVSRACGIQTLLNIQSSWGTNLSQNFNIANLVCQNCMLTVTVNFFKYFLKNLLFYIFTDEVK